MNEEERNALSEQEKIKHARTKKIFKIVGIILLITGIAFIIAGFADFISSMTKFEAPRNFWCLFIGFPLTAFGGMLTMLGFKKEIMRYGMRESTPVFNEAGKEIQPGVSAIANAVKESDNKVCPSCGELNDNDASFCKKCGASLNKQCPYCGEKLDADAVFCDKCGKKLE